MPEGDTIWRAANALRPRLTGKLILDVRPVRFNRLQGATVTAVETRGKHLLIRFDSGLVLHTHMRMTGCWQLYRPGEPWLKPATLAKVVLGNQDTVAVLFNAPVVELLREREPERELAHLGPDILAPELDLDEILRRARSAGRQALGELLLNQRVAAGIGNIYKCESLWRQHLDPWRPASELEEAALAAVFSEARNLMVKGLRRHPPHAVHGRAGRGCPGCSGRVLCRNQGEPPRLTYYCPTCQQSGLR